MKIDLELDRETAVPLTDQLVAVLRARISSGNFEAGMRLPPLKDLAETLKIGQGTVRRALEQLAREGYIEKRRKLGTFVCNTNTLHHAEEMAYSHEQRSRLHDLNVAIIIDPVFLKADSGSKRINQICDSFEMTISREGGRCFVSSWAAGIPTDQFFTHTANANAYFYIHQEDHGHELVKALINSNAPLVMCDYRAMGALNVNTVIEDWGWGGREIMEHLLLLGHRHIAFAGYYRKGPQLPWVWVEERTRTFLEIAQMEGLPICGDDIYMDEFFKHGPDEGPEIIQAGERLMKKILLSDRKYSAIIGANDYIALGLLKAAREEGINVPENLSLVGFDNHPLGRAQNLTSVNPANEQDGASAAKILINAYLQPQPDSITTVVNKPILIKRGTTSVAANLI